MTANTTSSITTATGITQVIDGYFAMWNETEPEQRKAIIAATWDAEANYVDPHFAANSYETLDAMVVAVHKQFPGYRFTLTEAIDAHHDRVRWGWTLGGPNGEPPVAVGVDFATLAADGRLREVTGFFVEPSQQ